MESLSMHRVAEAMRVYNATESQIHAWVEVNPQEPLGDGPLDGIPFGVKDIFETTGLATEYGSTLYLGRKGTFDAEIVTTLRQLGGILFGKTQTTAFASFDPSPTRNPHNLAHTPGGSSSGSAAAVAAGVVPFALGTQTMGSVIRPASFCGVVGFKPTFGKLPVHGVLPFAPSLDTVGFLVSDVATCIYVWRALGFQATSGPIHFGIPENLPPVSEGMQTTFENTVGILRQEHQVEKIDLPRPYEELLEAARLVNDYEGSRSLEKRWRDYGDNIGQKLANLVRRGLQISDAACRESLHCLQEASESVEKVFTEFPFLLTPSALSSAPEGFASTGDPAMNAVWTALGTPVVGLPMPASGDLPLGLQMIGARDTDACLLNAALDVERLVHREPGALS
jgi:Asp-tRNA(Asn)/Glu-tRNA(Gln) amidotransferase A subunit family amidase